MPKIEDYKPEDKIVALHISRSGHGKSAAAASYPKPFHEYDFDGRFDGIAGACKSPIGTGFLDPEGISFDRFYTKPGFEPFDQELEQLQMLHVQNGRFKYKTIELASITSFVQALINSSHKLQTGKMIGRLRMSGPGDFNFEITGIKQLMDYFYGFPCHIIVSAHIIDKYGKGTIIDPKTGVSEKDTYGSNVIVGEKLNLRDNVGETLLSCFSNVFRFEKEIDRDNNAQFYVEFNTDIAKNAFGIPPGRFNITGKPFYPFLQDLIQKIRKGEDVRPKTKTMNFFKKEGE